MSGDTNHHAVRRYEASPDGANFHEQRLALERDAGRFRFHGDGTPTSLPVGIGRLSGPARGETEIIMQTIPAPTSWGFTRSAVSKEMIHSFPGQRPWLQWQKVCTAKAVVQGTGRYTILHKGQRPGGSGIQPKTHTLLLEGRNHDTGDARGTRIRLHTTDPRVMWQVQIIVDISTLAAVTP